MLFQAIEAACAAARESGGLVTPTVLDAVEEVGYRGSFTGPQIQARCADDTRCQPVPSWQAIELDEAALRVRLPRGTRLDLGGTAKGWLADRLCHTFRGPALVDLGGDIAVNGPRSDGSAWPIAIARVEPNEPEPPLLLLASGGVATSGRDYRVFARGHHLIDPRCGAAARTRVVSASAIAESALAAEVAAKVVLLADAEAGFPWVQKRLRVAARALFEGGRVVTSSRFLHHTWQDHDTAQTA
jgi:thiamine biosynthesis lipoprotein